MPGRQGIVGYFAKRGADIDHGIGHRPLIRKQAADPQRLVAIVIGLFIIPQVVIGICQIRKGAGKRSFIVGCQTDLSTGLQVFQGFLVFLLVDQYGADIVIQGRRNDHFGDDRFHDGDAVLIIFDSLIVVLHIIVHIAQVLIQGADLGFISDLLGQF